MDDQKMYELLRDMTEPEPGTPDAKADARARVMERAGARSSRREHVRSLGGRGLAVMAALVAIPAGAAVATELGGEDRPELTRLADCPEVVAIAEERGLAVAVGSVEMAAKCPSGEDAEALVSMIGTLLDRRTGGNQQPPGESGPPPPRQNITIVGDDGAGGWWGLRGVSGSDEPALPPPIAEARP